MQITRNFAQKWKPKKKKLKNISLWRMLKKSLSSLSQYNKFSPTTTPPKKIIIPQIFLFLLFWKELYSSHFTTLHNEWRILPYPTTQIQMHLNVAHSGWWKDKIEMKKKPSSGMLTKKWWVPSFYWILLRYWNYKDKKWFFADGAIKWHS